MAGNKSFISYKDDNDNWFIAWWLPWNMQEYLPELARIDIQMEGVTMTDPVLVDLLSAEVYEVGDVEQNGSSILFKGMVLADYPLVLAERGTINLMKE